MDRRTFLAGTGAMLLATPLAVEAQQAGKVHRIGYLNAGSAASYPKYREKFVQGLRDAGMTVYKAAQTKNQDKMLEAADVMTTACANCHDKYREKPNLAARCQ